MSEATPAGTNHGSTRVVNRARHPAVALESTLLLHGVPRDAAIPLATELDGLVRARGAHPSLVALVHGAPTVGVTHDELRALLDAPSVPKANTSNLGTLIHRRSHAATTVAATMELAAAAGVRLFATGGLGGMHHHYGQRWDASADLAALARFPVAVVASGTKSILDVASTREMLESLGVPVVGFRADRFPAFYLRESEARLDARFDDHQDLAAFVAAELARTGRGLVVANPIPEHDAIDPETWRRWMTQAQAEAGDAAGRDITPRLLARLHEVSGGRTLQANLSLVRANTSLAAELAVRLPEPDRA